MEDFSQLCHVLQTEYNARSIPFSLQDYARMGLESLADLISEDRPEQFHSAMARFFASLYGGNELLNRLPVQSRESLSSMTIGFPPRRLFELLNDFGHLINELSLAEMSSKTLRLAFEENGFPYRPNEFFSLIEQFERLEARLWEPEEPKVATLPAEFTMQWLTSELDCSDKTIRDYAQKAGVPKRGRGRGAKPYDAAEVKKISTEMLQSDRKVEAEKLLLRF